jgi:hypothetical protein
LVRLGDDHGWEKLARLFIGRLKRSYCRLRSIQDLADFELPEANGTQMEDGNLLELGEETMFQVLHCPLREWEGLAEGCQGGHAKLVNG